MIDTMKILILTVLFGTCSMLAGCGGGSAAPAPATTKIAGTASKGPIASGTVRIYSIDSVGNKSATALATATTDSNGLFSTDIGVYSGGIVLEVTGTYIDEATGSTVTIDSTRPMRAVISAVGPTTTTRVAVTPLTDLAYSLAGTLTATNIAAANARVSALFKISDISTVEPVQPTITAMNAAGVSQQTYTLALATLSQMAKTDNPASTPAFIQIATILTSFMTDLNVSATAGLGTTNSNAFASALGVMSSGSLKGFNAATATLGNAGTNSLTLTLTTSGVPSGTLIGGLQGRITYPAGTSMRLDPAQAGSVLSGLFTLTGNAVTSLATNAFVAPIFSFGIVNASGFDGGDFATLVVDVSSGSPTAASFNLSNVTVIDTSGAAIPGATVTLK